MTNEEKNIEIARFMGVDVEYSDAVFKDSISELRHYINNRPKSECLLFDEDWNWFMKAWYKFRDLNLDDKLYSDNRQNIAHKMSFKTISEAFEALYEGIYWYNSTRK